jgi:hypothetical protein
MAALLLYGYRTTCGFYAAVRITAVTSLRRCNPVARSTNWVQNMSIVGSC